MLSNELITKYSIHLFEKDLTSLIEKYNIDEPFFIVDLLEIVKAYIRWIHCLPNVKAYYAIKCNPNPVILAVLNELGCNFDCASKNEIKKILDLTQDPEKIIFAHPCKYPTHLLYAKEHKINLMTFDCIEELYKIKEFHPNASILLRLAVDDSHSLCKFNKKFGCKPKDVLVTVQKAKELNMNFKGFSFHVGSSCLSADTYYDALKICKDATIIAKYIGYTIDTIDVGGGFIAENTENEVSFEDISKCINKGINDFFNDMNISFIGEPGRYMVQKSHTLIITIIAKKQNEDGFIYYINDGIYGSFNCIFFDHQRPILIPIKNYVNCTLYKSQIFGNTCDSLDEITECVMLPELFIGDHLYVKNFGAYTTSAKSDNFNGYAVEKFEYIYDQEFVYEIV